MEAEPVLLDETLRPSPPMAPQTLLIILGVVLAFNIAFALSFVLRGAWPIAPFLGLDVALLAWAFRASTLAARRSERVTVTPSRLRIEQHPAKGAVTQAEFNPYWVRLNLEDRIGRSSELSIASHGKRLVFAAFLTDPEREDFAQALSAALSANKAPRPA